MECRTKTRSRGLHFFWFILCALIADSVLLLLMTEPDAAEHGRIASHQTAGARAAALSKPTKKWQKRVF
jgi:hypothetical protein